MVTARLTQLLISLAFLVLAGMTYVAALIIGRGGFEYEDIGAAFTLGPAVLIYAVAAGTLAARPPAGAR